MPEIPERVLPRRQFIEDNALNVQNLDVERPVVRTVHCAAELNRTEDGADDFGSGSVHVPRE